VQPPLRAAEFFAGTGLVRAGLAEAGGDVAWENDIEPIKATMYGANFGLDNYCVRDVRAIRGTDIPTVEIATASFPRADLSLAGLRRGLSGDGRTPDSGSGRAGFETLRPSERVK
jgi:DNA (cytosine-5)-methyltransferase 1